MTNIQRNYSYLNPLKILKVEVPRIFLLTKIIFHFRGAQKLKKKNPPGGLLTF